MSIKVKTYKDAGQYKRDVRGMARQGWHVVDTTTERKTGWFGSFLGLPVLKIGRLFNPFGSTTTFVVTYEK